MATQTQEQKDIELIKEDITRIRKHLDNIKQREDDSIVLRGETNRKLDLLVNSLTDNDFNGKNGYLTRLNKVEAMVIAHDMYWKVLFTIVVAGGVVAGVVKFFIVK